MTQKYFMYAGHRYDINSTPSRFSTRSEAKRYIKQRYYGFGVTKQLPDGKWVVGQIIARRRR